MDLINSRFLLQHKRDHILFPDHRPELARLGTPMGFDTTEEAEAYRATIFNGQNWRVIKAGSLR